MTSTPNFSEIRRGDQTRGKMSAFELRSGPGMGLLFAFGFLICPPPTAAAALVVGYLSGCIEYASEASLISFAADMESRHGTRSIHFRCRDIDEGSSQANPTRLGNIASLDSVDVLLIFSRRCWLLDEHFQRVRAFLESDKGKVGLRTASHAFQNWGAGRGIDSAVWGGAYNGHGSASGYGLEPTTQGQEHSILAGVGAWRPSRTLYFQNLPGRSLAPDATVLLHGSNGDGRHPVAWTRMSRGAPVFYTSAGVQEDFKNPEFRNLLANAVLWAGRRGPVGIASPYRKVHMPEREGVFPDALGRRRNGLPGRSPWQDGLFVPGP